MTRLVAVLAVAVVLAGVPGAALGHAELATVTPADTSTVGGPPAEIVMTFTEPLDPGRSSIRLVDAGGALVAEGGTIDPGDDVGTMRLALPAVMTPGTYTIRWTSFSTQDNERNTGTTTFTLAPSTAPPTIGPSNPPVDVPSASSPTASDVASAAPSRSAPPTTPIASTGDALIPVIVVVLAILGLGLWLARGRSRRGA